MTAKVAANMIQYWLLGGEFDEGILSFIILILLCWGCAVRGKGREGEVGGGEGGKERSRYICAVLVHTDFGFFLYFCFILVP